MLFITYIDLAGNNDGAIRIYEYGHREHLQEPRAAGVAPRPTRLQFNSQGNKVCYIHVFDLRVNNS